MQDAELTRRRVRINELEEANARLVEQLDQLQQQGMSADYSLSDALGMTTLESDGSVANIGTWPEMLAEVKRLKGCVDGK